MALEHAKTIAKHSVFITSLHEAREPVPFVCEKGLVDESDTVFYTILRVDFG